MKPIPFVFFACFAGILTGCAEPLPLKLGMCRDNVCATIETVIPARSEAALRSAKEVEEVQPVP